MTKAQFVEDDWLANLEKRKSKREKKKENKKHPYKQGGPERCQKNLKL